MAENKTNGERLLEGQTTVTPSSDEASIADLKARLRQYHGIPDPEIVIEGDQLLVRPVAGITSDALTASSPIQKQTELADLTPDNVIRLTVERDQLTAARNAGVPRQKLLQLKQYLRAA